MPLENRLTKIGDLDRWITYRVVTNEPTATGGFREVSTEVGRWARLESRVRGIKEVSEGGQEIAMQQDVFVTRYFSGYKKVDQIVHDDKVYDIIAANEIGRRQYLQFTTELRD